MTWSRQGVRNEFIWAVSGDPEFHVWIQAVNLEHWLVENLNPSEKPAEMRPKL